MKSHSLNEGTKVESKVNALDALIKLKVFQKFDSPDLAPLVDTFPLAVSPVSSEMQDLLRALADLTDVIPRDKTYPLYKLLSQVMLHSLTLAHSLASIDVDERNKKVLALTKAINTTKALGATPKYYNDPGKVKDEGEKMHEVIDTSWYMFRNARESIISNSSYKLKVTLKTLSEKVLLRKLEYQYQETDAQKLSTKELTILKKNLYDDRAYYDNACQILNVAIPAADYEFLKANGAKNDFDALLIQIQRMHGYKENFKESEAFAYPEFSSVLNSSQELTLEIITSKSNVQEKLVGLSNLLAALINFSHEFGNNIRRTELDRTTADFRLLMEGSTFNRQEHKLANSVLAISATIIQTATLAGLLFIAATQPITLGFGFWALFCVNVGGLAGTTNWLSKIIYPDNVKQQSISRTISKTVDGLSKFYRNNPADSMFHPLPEMLEEKTPLAHTPSSRVVNTEEDIKLLEQFEQGIFALQNLQLLYFSQDKKTVAYRKLVSEFTLEFSPVTREVVSALKKLSTLSQTLFNQPTPLSDAVKDIFAENIQQILLHIQLIAKIDVQNRQTRLQETSKIITEHMLILNTLLTVAYHNAEEKSEKKMPLAFPETCTPEAFALRIKLAYVLNNFAIPGNSHARALANELPEAQAALIDTTAKATVLSYQTYKESLNDLSDTSSTFDVCKSVAVYENIKADCKEEFINLLSNLKTLKKFIDSNAHSPFIHPLCELMKNANGLAIEFAQTEYNPHSSAKRRAKVIALNETLIQTITFADFPADTAKDDLIKSCWNMRNTIEGSYFQRAENRLAAGFFGAINNLLAIAAIVATITLIMVFPPVTPLAIVGTGLCMLAETALFATSLKIFGKSIYPSQVEEQSYSRNLYQQANQLPPSIFKKPKKEEVATASALLHQPVPNMGLR